MKTVWINTEVCIDHFAFDDRLTEEMAFVVRGDEIVRRLAEAECTVGESVPLVTSDGEKCGRAWITERKEQEDG